MTLIEWTCWFLFLGNVWFAWRAKDWKAATKAVLKLCNIQKTRIAHLEDLVAKLSE